MNKFHCKRWTVAVVYFKELSFKMMRDITKIAANIEKIKIQPIRFVFQSLNTYGLLCLHSFSMLQYVYVGLICMWLL